MRVCVGARGVCLCGQSGEARPSTPRVPLPLGVIGEHVGRRTAEAYLSANVPSIPTLSRLQDLEAFYGIQHAIPTRPLPSHRELPLRRVRFEDRMSMLHDHVEQLT
jgi:hypothetical protein